MQQQPLTPHGPGFSFMDTAELAAPDTGGRPRAVATLHLDPARPFFADHFPGRPLMPGVLMIEAAAQAAGWLWAVAAASPAAAGAPRELHLAAVQAFRFHSPALPGETLRIEVTLDKELGPRAQFTATLRVGDRLVAEGSIALSRPE
ncbi:hypothetical protein DB346_10690 [Verrucomicrobia bacterium LW23]|nr:hypothetical protein DB346_10690 [Verrucomicrobia bacterium LW23]